MSEENDDRTIEALLREIPLRAPSRELDARVDAVFSQYHQTTPGSEVFRRGKSGGRRLFIGPAPSRPMIHRFAIAAGILLAIGIGLRLSLPKRVQPIAVISPTVTSHPIRLEQETSTIIDDGVVAGSDDAAYQQFRRRTVREIYYEDPKTHSKLQVTIPTEQVVIQKVEFY